MDNIENLRGFIDLEGNLNEIDDNVTIEEFAKDYCEINASKIEGICPDYKELNLTFKDLLIEKIGYVLYVKDIGGLTIKFPDNKKNSKKQLNAILSLLKRQPKKSKVNVKEDYIDESSKRIALTNPAECASISAS